MADDEKTDMTRVKIRFLPEIGLGQAIQALVVVAGFAWGIMTYAGKVDTTQREVSDLRTDMTRQLAAIQLSVNDQFKQVRIDIANLPDLRAELTQLEKRADQIDNRAGAQSDRLGKLESLTIQFGSKVDTLTDTVTRMTQQR